MENSSLLPDGENLNRTEFDAEIAENSHLLMDPSQVHRFPQVRLTAQVELFGMFHFG